MAKRFAIEPTDIIQTGFYRQNLALSILPVLEYAKNTVLIEQIRQQRGAGIVYVTLQKTAMEVAQLLQSANVNAVAYHAGLDDEVRGHILRDFMANKSRFGPRNYSIGIVNQYQWEYGNQRNPIAC